MARRGEDGPLRRDGGEDGLVGGVDLGAEGGSEHELTDRGGEAGGELGCT